MVKCYIKDYPRPMFVRDNWQSLNGAWSFSLDDELKGLSENGFTGDYTIEVPFTCETEASGIGLKGQHRCVWYCRKINIPQTPGKRTILNFEGSDYETRVWVNGTFIGTHRGGYERFSFDITDALCDCGENMFVIRVEDSMSKNQPRGKQRFIEKSTGCWYVQTTGIWKTLWLEQISPEHISTLKLTPDAANDNVRLEAACELPDGANAELRISVELEGDKIAEQSVWIRKRNVDVTIPLIDPEYGAGRSAEKWEPCNPVLYDLKVELVCEGKVSDEVGSYFGLRSIGIHGDRVLLNSRELYQRLALDQGYWPQSGITAPSEESLIEDIEKLQQLGFNGVRKHQKIEDERFLFWSDVKGFLVWSEFPATYAFSDEAMHNFMDEWQEIIRQYYNHPSIITWTPFNESWGLHSILSREKAQQFTMAVYYTTKAFDSTRPVITNDGWEHTISDIITLHEYTQDWQDFLSMYQDKEVQLGTKRQPSNRKYSMANGFEYSGQPVIISEYGGIAIAGKGEGWGYGTRVTDPDGLAKRYAELTGVIYSLPYVCGFCYTQVTDVEQEVNGLMTPDRQFKCDPEAIRRANLNEK